MTSLPTVLFFTYPEYGQANVNFATSYELALAGANVCIASFASLKDRVSYFQELVARHSDTSKPTGSVKFYECKGFPSFMEMFEKHGLDVTTFPHSHGVSGALKSYSALNITFFPWSPKEHLAAIESIKDIIATVKPNAVVIDVFFYIAMDACKLMDQKFIIMLPNSIKDVAACLQPYFAALWKYPVMSSGFSFPLKWWQIPLNIYLYMRLAIQMMTSTRVRQIQALRKSLGIKPTLTWDLYPGVTHICPALPETDFPFVFIPEEMVLCGPIIMPFDPLEESDPSLISWLYKGPTVMINFGSHTVSNTTLAREMASAICILLENYERRDTGKLQVLWKVKASGDIRRAIDNVIGKEIEQGRVKVVAWLEAEPVSILQHPNVVCTVHHGGANSFFEGIWSGVPHVVLPVWLDTYDYAVRAEFLNVGLFGNKRSAPGILAEELGDALVRVTGDTEEAHTFRLAANRLKAVCRAKGDGRKLSSATILKEIGITK